MTFKVSNLYLIAFKDVKGIGNKTLRDIYSKFKNFQKAYNASIDEFKEIVKDKRTMDNISEFLSDRDKIIQKVKILDKNLTKKNIKFVSYFDKEYPSSLQKIKNPPIGLYIKGKILFSELEKSISIIGTRNPTYYGHSKARTISREMAVNGYVIISGLARGVDIEAHLGALEGGGKTIAVLGSGVENIYPNEHVNTSKDVIKEGALISELNIDQRLNKYSLISRNRIISGLSKASLIIEGNLNSGTRHEANFAKDQNKYIFTLRPINPNNETSKLPLALIKDNAIEIQRASEILEYLNSKTSKENITQPKPKLITEFANSENKSGIADFKKINIVIPKTVNPFDERIILLLKIIKNLMISYYEGGLKSDYDRKLNKKIFLLTKLLNKFDNSYLSEFIRLPSRKPNYQGLSSLFFNCDIGSFKKKLTNQKVQKEDVKRRIFTLSGDLALVFQDFFKSHINDEKLFVKDIHHEFCYKINSENEFFNETLSFNNFKEALTILKEYGLIKLIGEEYKEDTSNTMWKILDKLRLKEFINWSSIDFLLNHVTEGILH